MNPPSNHHTTHTIPQFQPIYTKPSTHHLHPGKYLINYIFIFHNILLIYEALTYSYLQITLLQD